MNIKSLQMFVPLFVASHRAVTSTQSTQIDRLNVHIVVKYSGINSNSGIDENDNSALVDNYLIQLNFIEQKWRIARTPDVCNNDDI